MTSLVAADPLTAEAFAPFGGPIGTHDGPLRAINPRSVLRLRRPPHPHCTRPQPDPLQGWGNGGLACAGVGLCFIGPVPRVPTILDHKNTVALQTSSTRNLKCFAGFPGMHAATN